MELEKLFCELDDFCKEFEKNGNKNYGYQLKAGQSFAITRLKPLQAGTLSGSVFPP